MYPLKLQPVFKEYLWGGHKLHDRFSMECKGCTAEAWLLSCNEDGQSKIENGMYKGIFLSELIKSHPEIMGKKYSDKFPVIIKFIDASDKLSIQVHPIGENCKNEMWYVIDCEENSTILYGLKQNISKDEFIRHIQKNTVTDIMNAIPVKKGDVFYIPAGTLHAIGKGILIAEIQQNSNVTYRVYDYEREDSEGNKRPLHIAEAVENAKLSRPYEIYHKTVKRENIKILNECEFFKVSEIEINDSQIIHADSMSFASIIVIDGEGFISENDGINAEKFKKGDSFFLSAGCDYKINGKSKIILTKV